MKINFKNLTVQVLVAIILGILVGQFGGSWVTSHADQFKLLSDLFVKMIKMVITPIIFFTIVIGIANMKDMKKLGRIGGKAILYFEIVTTVSLAIGLVVMNVIHPGTGMSTHGATAAAVAKYTNDPNTHTTVTNFILSIVPDNVVGALAQGNMIPVLFFSVLFGVAMAALNEKVSQPVVEFFEKINTIFFRIVAMVMKFSPFAAFGAMTYTIGKFGIKSLGNLGLLMGSIYLTMAIFIFVVLGLIAKFYKFNIFSFLKFIKDEILLTLGTSSSESALPQLMEKLEKYGCSKSVVGLVVPTGYSFNLDGTSIYLSAAALFIAQAFGIDMGIGQQLALMGVLMLTSKGAAGVTGSGFVTLAATLAVFPSVPVAGLALLIGIDRFMSEARAITNIIGNGVATVVVSKMEKEFHAPAENVEA